MDHTPPHTPLRAPPRTHVRGLRHAAFPALAAVLLAMPPGASAQAPPWPSRPVTLVIGTPPGGAIDAYARALAHQLGKVTGGTFIVDYKPGANGNLSAEFVQKAAADGHTLWIGTQAMVTINPSAYSGLRWKPADFRPIAKGVEAPLVFVAHPSVPAHSFAEVVKWAAASPGKVSFSSYSPGTPSHFLGYQMNERFKTDMVHIPYKGSAPQVVDLIGGQVPVGFAQLQTTLPQVQAGKLNALAVTSAERSRYLPQVPTLAELGYKDFNTTIWFGLLAAAAVPKPILDAIEAATVKAQADPEYKAKLDAQGFDVPDEHGSAFAQTIAAETARWARLVKSTGFKAND